MKLSLVFTILCISIFSFLSVNAQLPAPDQLKAKKGDILIQPVFHGTLVLQWNKKTIYVDPYNGAAGFKTLPLADLVLITDIHGDHMDTNTLNSLDLSKAKIIVPQAVADLLPAKFKDKLIVLANEKTIENSGITITALPMYNIPDDSTSRHKKGRGNGYVLEIGGKRFYISGDTEDIPEMRALKNIDVAFVCMNQPFTMTVDQAASAVLEFKPKIVYPYHFRNREGFTDTEAFKKLVNEKNTAIDVRIRNWYSQVK